MATESFFQGMIFKTDEELQRLLDAFDEADRRGPYDTTGAQEVCTDEEVIKKFMQNAIKKSSDKRMTKHIILSVDQMISVEGIAGVHIQEVFDTFRCTRNLEKEDFLRNPNKAMALEKRAVSRTYLAASEDLNEIFGYFSLGMRFLKVPSESALSENVKEKMNVDPLTGFTQSYIIGQLGRSDNSPKGFSGVLLKDAVDRIKKANTLVGCRVIGVDCSDELVEYYEEHGFSFMLRKNQPENKPALNQMVLIL